MPSRRWSSTSCAAPVVPHGFVARPRLDALVESGVSRGVVLVSAPPGYGKTLLLAGWAAHRAAPTSWVTVEPDDADPHLFWSRVLRALQTAPGLPSSSRLARLEPPSGYDAAFPAALVEACAELPRPHVLVLDDLHQMMGTPTLATLDAVVRTPQGALRLVLATRADPSLGLQRLRLSDELTEVRARDLAFDAVEAGELLGRHDVHLAPEQLHEVLGRTEGWAAGLRLAALSLGDRDDLDAAVAALAGDQRTVGDYLVEEVLARQPPEVTSFLLETCVVGRVTADLANALTGRTDGQRMLALLESENLFVVGLDERRTWYRYHHMFGQLLRHQLLVDRPERVAELHRAAATWFAGEGEPVDAARHLAAAGEWADLARYVVRTAGDGLLGPDRTVLQALLRQVPAAVAETEPEAAAAAAAACYVEHDATGLRAHVARARAGRHRLAERDAAVLDALLLTLEAVAAWLDDDPEAQVRGAAAARRALATVTDAEVPALPAYRAVVTTILALGHLWAGRIDDAEAELGPLAAGDLSDPAPPSVLTMPVHGGLALVMAVRGRLSTAVEEASVALAAGRAAGWLEPSAALAHLARAAAALERGQTTACAADLARAEAAVGPVPSPLARTGLALVGARLDLTRGSVEAAVRALGEVREPPGARRMPRFLADWCTVLEADADLARGRSARAVELLQGLGLSQGEPTRLDAVMRAALARALLADGRAAEARAAVEPGRSGAAQDRVAAVELWLAAALVDDALRDDAAALEDLGHALDAAAPEGLARPFLRGEARMRPLLRHYRQTSGSHTDFVSALLALLDQGAAPTEELTEPLTGRERSVLALLPAMMSNAEIADELFVSVNTVKVHLKSLYRKLGVQSRREAVRRARDLGLLRGSEKPGVPA